MLIKSRHTQYQEEETVTDDSKSLRKVEGFSITTSKPVEPKNKNIKM